MMMVVVLVVVVLCLLCLFYEPAGLKYPGMKIEEINDVVLQDSSYVTVMGSGVNIILTTNLSRFVGFRMFCSCLLGIKSVSVAPWPILQNSCWFSGLYIFFVVLFTLITLSLLLWVLSWILIDCHRVPVDHRYVTIWYDTLRSITSVNAQQPIRTPAY